MRQLVRDDHPAAVRLEGAEGRGVDHDPVPACRGAGDGGAHRDRRDLVEPLVTAAAQQRRELGGRGGRQQDDVAAPARPPHRRDPGNAGVGLVAVAGHVGRGVVAEHEAGAATDDPEPGAGPTPAGVVSPSESAAIRHPSGRRTKVNATAKRVRGAVETRQRVVALGLPDPRPGAGGTGPGGAQRGPRRGRVVAEPLVGQPHEVVEHQGLPATERRGGVVDGGHPRGLVPALHRPAAGAQQQTSGPHARRPPASPPARGHPSCPEWPGGPVPARSTAKERSGDVAGARAAGAGRDRGGPAGHRTRPARSCPGCTPGGPGRPRPPTARRRSWPWHGG